MKLRAILLILGLLAFVSTSVGGYLYYSALKISVFNEAEIQAASQAETIKVLLSSYLSNNLNAVRALAGLKEIQQAFGNPNEIALTEANSILDNFSNSFGASVSYMMNQEGNTIASSNRDDRNSFVGKNYSFRPYFQKAIRGNPAIYMALGVTSKKRGLYYCYPVYERTEKGAIGVVILKTSAEAVESELLSSLNPAPGIFKLITGPHGVVFMSDHKEFLYRLLWKITDGERIKISKLKQFGKGPWEWTGFERKGKDRAVDKSGDEYLMFQKKIESLPGWNIVYLSNLETISKRVSTPFVKIVGYLTLILCALIGLSVFILYRLAKSDITNRLKAEKALRESEKEYRSTLNDLLVGVVVHAGDSSILLCNPEAMNILGLTYEQMSGKKVIDPAWNFVHGDSTIMKVEDYPVSKVFSTKKPLHDYIVGVNRPDRDYLTWVIVNAIPVVSNDNELQKIVVNFVDITSHKKAEKALRESEEKLQAIFKANPDPVVVYDTEGYPQYLNPAFTELFGWSLDELRGRRIPFVPEDQREIAAATINKIYTYDKTENIQARRLTKQGDTIDVIISAATITGPEGKPIGLVVNLRDISEQIKLEAQLQQARKMEALGTLAGGIAHDFNNLLMAIQGRTSIMLMNKDSSHPDFGHLKGIEDNVDSAADLTKQLLGFARGGKYEVKTIDMNELIKKQNRMFGRTKKEVTIRGKYEKDLWTVEVDRGQIEQVLLNLYVNAWQAMPGGGDLHLETENVTLDDIFVKPFSIEPGRYVKISVTDTGVGMDKATREKIFDPFFTTKEMGRGTGLGLASAYGIIKNHGGFINVYSEKGHGTTLNVYLPASEKEVIEYEKSTGGLLRGSETVLFVDDEDMIIEVAKEVLEHLGYKVLIAGNGKEAIGKYEEHKAQIDIVILDMIMPDMSGSDTYDRMKEIDPDIKILLSSGYSINGQATEIMDRGCNGFIQKPFKMKELSQKLREILDDK